MSISTRYSAEPEELIENGFVRFEGDPGLTLIRISHRPATPSAPTSAGDGERADARIVEIPTAFDWSSRHAMAVTREWCRGWDDLRAEMKGKS